MEMPSGWWRCGGWSGLGLLGPALVLRPPPDADHVVAGDGHHVLVVVTAGHLQDGRMSVLGQYSCQVGDSQKDAMMTLKAPKAREIIALRPKKKRSM